MAHILPRSCCRSLQALRRLRLIRSVGSGLLDQRISQPGPMIQQGVVVPVSETTVVPVPSLPLQVVLSVVIFSIQLSPSDMLIGVRCVFQTCVYVTIYMYWVLQKKNIVLHVLRICDHLHMLYIMEAHMLYIIAKHVIYSCSYHCAHLTSCIQQVAKFSRRSPPRRPLPQKLSTSHHPNPCKAGTYVCLN